MMVNLHQTGDNNSTKTLRFVLVDNKLATSFNPLDSDMVPNAVRMEQLVGNLVKEVHGNTGRSEPYLAENWTVTPDGLAWEFLLRPNLRCEDGTEINAAGYAKSLTRTLRRLTESNDVPVFKLLDGWESFKTDRNKEISGIEVPDQRRIRFKFRIKPEGFLEYLAMPIYGFYCDSNFQGDIWKDNQKIISSGAYRLSQISKPEKIILEKRKNWLEANTDSPDFLVYENLDMQQAMLLDPKHTIMLIRQTTEASAPSNFIKMQGSPIFLTAIVLSPYKNGFFKNTNNRKSFRKQLRLIQQSLRKPSENAIFGNNFYLNSRATSTEIETETETETEAEAKIDNSLNKSEVTIVPLPVNQSTLSEYIESLVAATLDKLGIKYRFARDAIQKDTYWKKAQSNTEFDIRLARVDIGGNIENWVIKMMFCSKLGISFPDPSGRVCQLTSEFENRPERFDLNSYESQFNKIISDDAAVIPIFHSGSTWLFSSDIDLNSISPNLVVPRMEWIGLR